MAQKVTLDAMIRREDFALIESTDFALDLFQGFSLTNLNADAPVMRILRKPNFQRETNHWSPDQLVTFVTSFLDSEVIPSLILWNSPSFVFVIDGGHRLSALRAWMEDDYGDKAISGAFYGGEISELQKRVAKTTRQLVEKTIGRYSDLKALVGSGLGTEQQKKRAHTLVTRALPVLWIQGSASIAETSFFKINSQGTPLDDTEELLIKNRRKPIAISARAILRAGSGHKYWSAFPQATQAMIEQLASDFYGLMFQPEIDEPLKTLEVPLGGTVSPVDALSLLIAFLTITGSTGANVGKKITEFDDDADGAGTVDILKNSLDVVNRITGNGSQSLGLHPAVYFYNERGKYSRFMFLGTTMAIVDKLRNNDDAFFKKFTAQRSKVESFLIDNKSFIGILLARTNSDKRILKTRDLIIYLITEFHAGNEVSIENVAAHLGLHGRIIDVKNVQHSQDFSEDNKSIAFVRKAISAALVCPICNGKLDPKKSVQYDHKVRKREGGTGDPDNCQLVHPYCNSGVKN